MEVYVIFSVILFLFSIVSLNVDKKTDKFFSIVLLAMLMSVSAIRANNVGADTNQYIMHYSAISKLSINNIFSYSDRVWGSLEPGYLIYNYILSKFFTLKNSITIANSIFVFVLLCVIIRKVKMPTIFVFLYYTFGFYQASMNFTPNYISLLIVYISFLYNFSTFKKIIMICIATMFHLSALVFLPVLILIRFKIDIKKIAILTIITIGLIVFKQQFISFLNIIVPSKYAGYISNSSSISLEILAFVFEFIIILIAFALSRYYVGKQKSRTFIGYMDKCISQRPWEAWFFTIQLISYLLSFVINHFTRVAFIFATYNVIFVVDILDNIKYKNQRKKSLFLICCMCLFVYLFRININNIGGTIPYSTFIII